MLVDHLAKLRQVIFNGKVGVAQANKKDRRIAGPENFDGSYKVRVWVDLAPFRGLLEQLGQMHPDILLHHINLSSKLSLEKDDLS